MRGACEAVEALVRAQVRQQPLVEGRRPVGHAAQPRVPCHPVLPVERDAQEGLGNAGVQLIERELRRHEDLHNTRTCEACGAPKHEDLTLSQNGYGACLCRSVGRPVGRSVCCLGAWLLGCFVAWLLGCWTALQQLRSLRALAALAGLAALAVIAALAAGRFVRLILLPFLLLFASCSCCSCCSCCWSFRALCRCS